MKQETKFVFQAMDKLGNSRLTLPPGLISDLSKFVINSLKKLDVKQQITLASRVCAISQDTSFISAFLKRAVKYPDKVKDPLELSQIDYLKSTVKAQPNQEATLQVARSSSNLKAQITDLPDNLGSKSTVVGKANNPVTSYRIKSILNIQKHLLRSENDNFILPIISYSSFLGINTISNIFKSSKKEHLKALAKRANLSMFSITRLYFSDDKDVSEAVLSNPEIAWNYELLEFFLRPSNSKLQSSVNNKRAIRSKTLLDSKNKNVTFLCNLIKHSKLREIQADIMPGVLLFGYNDRSTNKLSQETDGKQLNMERSVLTDISNLISNFIRLCNFSARDLIIKTMMLGVQKHYGHIPVLIKGKFVFPDEAELTTLTRDCIVSKDLNKFIDYASSKMEMNSKTAQVLFKRDLTGYSLLIIATALKCRPDYAAAISLLALPSRVQDKNILEERIKIANFVGYNNCLKIIETWNNYLKHIKSNYFAQPIAKHPNSSNSALGGALAFDKALSRHTISNSDYSGVNTAVAIDNSSLANSNSGQLVATAQIVKEQQQTTVRNPYISSAGNNNYPNRDITGQNSNSKVISKITAENPSEQTSIDKKKLNLNFVTPAKQRGMELQKLRTGHKQRSVILQERDKMIKNMQMILEDAGKFNRQLKQVVNKNVQNDLRKETLQSRSVQPVGKNEVNKFGKAISSTISSTEKLIASGKTTQSGYNLNKKLDINGMALKNSTNNKSLTKTYLTKKKPLASKRNRANKTNHAHGNIKIS